MVPGIPHVEVLGVPVARLRRAEAIDMIERAARERAPALVAYANAHTLNLAFEDPSYRRLLRDRTAVVLNDGAGIAIAARLLGRPFFDNLNGSDFNPAIVALAARRGWPLYFLGGRPGVARRAAERLAAEIPGAEIAGTRHGYLEEGEDAVVAEEIRRSGAAVVMVAMGNPKQEQWLDRHLERTGAVLGVGVGAFFDFVAGEVPRAPLWMNRLGIEWMHRLCVEPRRLWRRYLVGNPLFLFRIARACVGGRPSA